MEIKVRHEGQDHSAEAQILQNTLWVHFQGRTFAVDAQPMGRKSRGKASSAAHPDQILAPMPGKVTKVLVVSGQNVEKAQAVLVMEAMKMEYTLKSEIAGRITDIQCKAGEQVTLGKLLVKLEPVQA